MFKAPGKGLMVPISDVIATEVTVARVGDEVANSFVEKSGGTVLEDSEVSFVYEIAERIFRLWNHL